MVKKSDNVSEALQTPKKESPVAFQRRLDQMKQEVHSEAERNMDVAVRILRQWIANKK